MKNYTWKTWLFAGVLAIGLAGYVGAYTSVPQALAQVTSTSETNPAEANVPVVTSGAAEAATVVNEDANVSVMLDPVLTIPYGQWIVAFQEMATPLIGVVLVFLFRALPESIVSIIRTAKVDQLLTKAVQSAVNQVAGAAKDKKLEIPVANDVVRKIVQYAVDEGPAWLIKWMGGVEGVKAKAIARIQVVDGKAIDPSAIDVSDIVPASKA